MIKTFFLVQFIVASMFTLALHTAHACEDNLEHLPVADEIKKLITDKNVKGIIDHLQPAHFIEDTLFTKKQVVELLNDNDSWLHKQLFTSAHSIRNYMLNT